MSERRFRVAHLSELPSLQSGPHPFERKPVRSHFGLSAFGVNAFVAPAAGDEVIEEHDELGKSAGRHEELYVVISGRATFTLEGERFEAPAGTLVAVHDPAVRRGAVAEEAGTTVLAVGGKVGEPFEVSAWEAGSDAFAVYRTGDVAGAKRRFAEARERHPGNPGLLYNLACLESLEGEPESALEHLRQSIEIDDDFRGYARDDSDFDPIRDDPRVTELLGS